MNEYKKYFENDKELLIKLEELHEKKYNMKNLIDKGENIEPFVTEFSGLPRTGKSSSLDKVYDFFKQANIKIEKTLEPAQIIKDSMAKEEVAKLTNLEFNNKTLEISKEELTRKIDKNPTIIIQDRGVIDNYFWYQMLYQEKKIDDEFYEKILLKLYQDLINVDLLFIMFAEPEIIILRDYINQIYLEDRKKTTIKRVTELRKGFESLLPLIEKNISKDNLIKLDTSNMNEMDTSIFIADKIMDGVNRKILVKKC